MSGGSEYYHKRSPPDLAVSGAEEPAAAPSRSSGPLKRGGGDERRHRSRSRSRSPSRRHHRRQRSRSRSRSPDSRRRRRHHSRSRSRDRGGRRHRERDRDSHRRHRDSRDSRSRSRGRRSRSRSHGRYHHYADAESRYAAEPRRSSHDDVNLDNLPLPKQQQQQQQYYQQQHHHSQQQPGPQNLQRDSIGAYYDLDTEEPIDKERIHREIEEKLRETLAKEGKVYPPPKTEASHPVFANDGSFLEIFKKMQEAQMQPAAVMSGGASAVSVPAAAAAAAAVPLAAPSTVGLPMMPTTSGGSTAAAYVAATSTGRSAPPPPLVGRRRGGKILKTGLVAKQKVQNDSAADPKDFWSLYLAEVNKYKSHACESETGNRPLVK